jgi:hypothetical protein
MKRILQGFKALYQVNILTDKMLVDLLKVKREGQVCPISKGNSFKDRSGNADKERDISIRENQVP